MNRTPRFVYAGTYERDYPRNRLTTEALRDAGMRVEEAHVPVWERVRDKSGTNPLQLARIAASLALAYGRLVPEVALRLLRCDALVVGYIGQADMLLLAPVAKLMRKPVLFDPLVTLTDTILEDRGLVSPRSPLAWAIAMTDHAALRLADVVLADTSENARYMTERFGVVPERIVVLPVGANEMIFYPNARVDWSDATPQRPLDVVFYGKFIPLHGIETIVRAASVVEARGMTARFELVGTGQTYREMRDLAARLNVSNITWTDWIPESALGDRLRLADVALGVFSGGEKAGRVVPNKVYQSLASRVATVTRESPAMLAFGSPFRPYMSEEPLPNPTKEEGLGRGLRTPQPPAKEYALLVPPDDPIALADAIGRLRSGRLRQQIAHGGHTIYENHTSASVRVRIIGQALERMMGSRWQHQPERG